MAQAGQVTHLPSVLRLGPADAPIRLPRWPAAVEEAAIETAESVPDHELFAFWMGATVLGCLDRTGLEWLAQTLRIPVKRRTSADRIRTWVVEHWPRETVQDALVELAARSNAGVPRGLWPALTRAATPSQAARLVHRSVIQTGVVDARGLTQLLVAMRLRGGVLADAYSLVCKDPRAKAALASAYEVFSGGERDLRSALAGLHLLHDGRWAAAVEGSAEVLLPEARHALAEEEAVRQKWQERAARLESELAALQGEMADMVALYENLLARAALAAPSETAATAGGEREAPVARPLAGRHLVIAGDPSHRLGYVALGRSLGASEVEFLDATQSNVRYVAERLQAADLAVVVTAFTTHKLTTTLDALGLPLLRVPQAGLRSMREALLRAAAE